MVAIAAGRKAADLIQQSEGLRLTAYRDTGGVLTIGYGHTGPDVYEGQTITKAEAERLLRQDMQTAANAVREFVGVPLSPAQFDALTSFVFNVGRAAFARSTLLRKLNARDYAGAAAEFDRWVYDNGRKLPGLVARRAEERALFEGVPA
jgi:lysozyme